ncbi:Hint domain-containing protein [Humitalea sp. 24SJ18S-53]|uniref:Hint domain-containing protein n=1 Tax=Humitalea sp. 24SJ18S-53 TaxID=3422307 RepID=UPI003D6787FB
MADPIHGTSGADTLTGTEGDDVIGDHEDFGENGLDVYRDSADDTLSGLGGNDRLIASGGHDTLLGGDGDDYLAARGGGDRFEGGAGNDYIDGRPEGFIDLAAGTGGYTEGGSYADGGAGDDRIGGSTGDDTLIGGEGNDSLLGLGGDDTLTGGAGNDIIRGFDGTDTVIFSGALADYAITQHASPTSLTGFETVYIHRHDVDAAFDRWSDYRYFTDLRPGSPDGTDTVSISGHSQVEFFQFSDGTYTFPAALQNLPCYVRGTAILTPRGEVPVESLRAGDLVTTPGGDRPLVWTGQRRVAPYRHPEPRRAQPIRIRAGALADGVPHHDLLVSPSHALLLDGHLVHAEALVNGATITQDTCAQVIYHHIELASHDIVLAEGAAAETYLDDGNRGLFGPTEALAPGPATPCAPVMGAAASAVLMRTLAARADALGWRRDPVPAVALLVDGRMLRPESIGPHEARFRLPGGSRSVLLLSPCARLGAMASADGRLLGLSLTRMEWAGATIDAEDARLARGFHGVERGHAITWRWTDGAGDLTPALGPALAEDGGLTIRWRSLCPAWVAPEASPLARRA